jgi:hypothetical protein
MATTVEELKQRMEQLEREVTSLRSAVDMLDTESPGGSAGALPDEWKPRRVRLSDRNEVLRHLDAAFATMGIDISRPALTGEEVQELMLREGVRPEDCLLSRGIIEAREE